MKNKIINYIRVYGFYRFLRILLLYPLSYIKKHIYKNRLLSFKSNQDRFTWIYNSKYWGTDSVSGGGSTLDYTQNIREQLPIIFTNFKIRKIFDAPCGDFIWMNQLLSKTNVDYIGADIVEEIILTNIKCFQKPRVNFIQMDLTSKIFPSADLMICRDCLFHLSFEDIKKILKNFVNSDIKFLLTTSYNYKNFGENRDIKSGDFRFIDLLRYPFNFPIPITQIEDFIAPYDERYLYLFSKEQLLSLNFIK